MSDISHKKLGERIKGHDHSFEYSDDPRVWRKGGEIRKELLTELQRLPTPVVARLIFKNVPPEFQAHWFRACGISP